MDGGHRPPAFLLADQEHEDPVGILQYPDKENLQLAKKPAECLAYVILHELAHLKVSNHGPEFKAILDRYMPDWRRIRKELNAGTADEGPERPA